MPKAPKASIDKTKVVHPNSRKAGYLQRQANRDDRVHKSKAGTTIKQEQLQQKLLWFQSNLDPQKSCYTKHELAQLTSQYMERFDDQLEQISIVKSVGNRQSKQHASRETAINITKERENYEFDAVGMEVPDLINGKALDYFKNWTGEIRYLQNIKLRKSKRSDIKETEMKEQTEEENVGEDNQTL